MTSAVFRAPQHPQLRGGETLEGARSLNTALQMMRM